MLKETTYLIYMTRLVIVVN